MQRNMKAMCSNCGVESEGGFCSKCGAPLSETDGVKKELPQREPELPSTEKCPVCQTGNLKLTTQKKLFWLTR